MGEDVEEEEEEKGNGTWAASLSNKVMRSNILGKARKVTN